MNLRPVRSHEREILLLITDAARDPSVQARLEPLLQGGVDWTVLVRAAINHQVVPLLRDTLLPMGAPWVPPDISQALEVWWERNRERQRTLGRAVLEVTRALPGQGIEAIFMRGPVQGQLAYRRLDLQEAVNPAVLLQEKELDRFHRLISILGYKPQAMDEDIGASGAFGRDVPKRSYLRVEDDCVIEAYTELETRSQGIRLDPARLRHRIWTQNFCGVPVPSLCPEDLVLVWCVFGSAAGWTVLSELCDLTRLLYSHPEIDIPRVHARARDQGVERPLLLGLGLADQVQGLSVDPALLADPPVQRMLNACLARIPLDAAEKSRPLVDALLQLRLRERWSERARYLLSSLRKACGPGFRGSKRRTQSRVATASARNKAHWSRRSDAWNKWAELTRPRSAAISRALIAAAGVDAGHRVLDLACGVGDTSLELSPLVGPDGLVMTTDLAFDMIARARHRADGQDLVNLRFCTAPMENLPFRESSFDGIVCRLGIMYCPRVQQALAEARRVLRPGARVAFLVCGRREENPVLTIINQVVTDLFELERRDADIDPFRFGVPGSLAQEMTGAGYLDVREQELNLPQRARAGTRFWQAGLERGMSLSLEDLPSGTRKTLVQRMTAAFEPFVRDGFYELPSLSRITRGTCPD